MAKQNTFSNAYQAQRLAEKADKMALESMLAHGYYDPRLSLSVKGTVEDFDKCKEYDQKFAYFRHVALKELSNQTKVNVQPKHDWASKAYA